MWTRFNYFVVIAAALIGGKTRQELVRRLIELRKSGKLPNIDWSDRILTIDHTFAPGKGGLR